MGEYTQAGIASWMGTVRPWDYDATAPLKSFEGEYKKNVDIPISLPVLDERGRILHYTVWAYHKEVATNKPEDLARLNDMRDVSRKKAGQEVNEYRRNILREAAKSHPELIVDLGIYGQTHIEAEKCTGDEKRLEWENRRVVVPFYYEGSLTPSTLFHVFGLPGKTIADFRELLVKNL